MRTVDLVSHHLNCKDVWKWSLNNGQLKQEEWLQEKLFQSPYEHVNIVLKQTWTNVNLSFNKCAFLKWYNTNERETRKTQLIAVMISDFYCTIVEAKRIHNYNIIAIYRKWCYIFRKIMFFVKFIFNFVYCVFCLILANEFDSKNRWREVETVCYHNCT